MNLLGVASGLATAVLWTITAVCFEAASRQIGSLFVNFLRLLLAALLFAALSLWRTGSMLPMLQPCAWFKLSLSGLIGFAVADLMLFQAFVLIGARLSMLIYASVPSIAALAGYWFMGERLLPASVAGMLVTTLGIGIAVLGKRGSSTSRVRNLRAGVTLAIGGSIGQAAGLLLGKAGAGAADAFAATQVRVLAGVLGFLLIVAARCQLPVLYRLIIETWRSRVTKNGRRDTQWALLLLGVGALLGPFLGVSLGLLSTQLLPAAIASTLMSIVPALLVPFSALFLREKVTRLELLGTFVAIAGVYLVAR